MKIDKIEQTVEMSEIVFTHKRNHADYTIVPIGEGKATLKTNPGKSLNELGINLGAEPEEAQEINRKIIEGLGMKLLSNNSIEYCIDIYTDFKIIENKHILKIFLKALEIHKYKSGKVDFIINGQWIDKADLKGLKGYKNSRAMKLYSKYEEQNMGHLKGDLIRLELILGARALEQNKINNIADIEKAKQEIREFLETMLKLLPSKMNRYSMYTKILIDKLLQKI